MTINERIKYLRKIIKINQKDFANKLGITQSGVSYIEQPNTIIAEKTIKTICSIFSVNENWLYNGIEPIFNDTENFELDKFAKSKGATELEIEILKAYFDLDKNIRKEVIQHFVNHFTKKTCFDKTTDEFIDDLNQNENDNLLKKKLD